MQIVIPMAGAGSRFASAGYERPKPFIEVNGKTMIQRVIENLRVNDAKYVLIAQRAHLEEYGQELMSLMGDYDIVLVPIDHLTEGTACTVLAAEHVLDNASPMFIANSDQLIDGGIGAMIADARSKSLSGSIMCFNEPNRDPKWSYARLDESTALVTEVREKQAISSLATVGVYYFSKAEDFFVFARQMIEEDDRVNGEFYTCPVYNYAIKADRRIGVFEISRSWMHGLGTPADLRKYLKYFGQQYLSRGAD